jgi:sigma-E factor negative regulatory protein RseA
MNTKEMAREQISALADGELAEQHMQTALTALRHQEARADWEIYHQIGDVLRSDDMAVTMSPQFTASLFERLESEPTIIAPPDTPFPQENVLAPNVSRSRASIGPTPPFLRRWAVPGMIAAAVATVAFVATPQLMVAMKSGAPLQGSEPAIASAEQIQPLKTSGATLASGQVDAVTATMPDGVVLRDPRIDDYLLAHQRFSPSMYSTAQFARSATFETAPGK